MADMPQFSFPKGGRGWIVVLAASFVGMVAGGITIMVLGKALK